MNKKLLIAIIVIGVAILASAAYFWLNPGQTPCLNGGTRSYVGGSGWTCLPSGATGIKPL
ncbi:MAG: hypothetical protein Q8912_14770 [Bacillota bacterium]|nr:hypothetical protein [Bacillota bacterium]